MKHTIEKLLLTAALLFGSLTVQARAQAPTVTLPSATASQSNLSWTNSANCTAATPCLINPYRIGGQCPANLAGTTGWTQLPATAAQATSATDTTVVAGQTYSYVVEATFVSGGSPSGPSNCVTVSIPNVPGVPTGLNATVTN